MKKRDPIDGGESLLPPPNRPPSGGGGVYPHPLPKATSALGVPLPVVYGTAKVAGHLVFMDGPSSAAVWTYKDDPQPVLRWKFIVNPANLMCGAASTTTTIPLQYGMNYYKDKNVVGKLVYFWAGVNAGAIRSVVSATHSSNQTTITLNAALSAAPYSEGVGDFIQVGAGQYGQTANVVMALCEAPITNVTGVYRDGVPKTSAAMVTAAQVPGLSTTYSFIRTSAEAATWAAMEAKTESQGMTMAGTARFNATHLTLTDGKVPDLQFEVVGQYSHPADVVVDLLTRRVPNPLQASQVVTDVGMNGLASGSYRTYCNAVGFTSVARALDSQTDALTALDELLEQTNSTAVWSDGKLKIVPLGDSTVGSYVPPSAVASIGVDELKFTAGQDPVSVKRTPDSSVFNCFPVSFTSSASDYTESSVEYIEPAHAASYGTLRASALSGTWICTETHALALATIKAHRSIAIRNTYSFKLSHRWVRLEPMDILLLTEPTLGLAALPVRVKSITEAADGSLQVEAWEWVAGAGVALPLPVQTYDGYASPALYPVDASIEVVNRAATDLSNVEDGSVQEPQLADGAVSARTLSVDVLSTSNYAEDGSGNPTAGAKLDHQGTALKVASGNLQIGTKFLSESQINLFDFGIPNYGFTRSNGVGNLTPGSSNNYIASSFTGGSGMGRTVSTVDGCVQLGATSCSLKVTVAGLYLVEFGAGVQVTSAQIQLGLFVNGTLRGDTSCTHYPGFFTAPHAVFGRTLVDLAANDQVECSVWALAGVATYVRNYHLSVQRMK